MARRVGVPGEFARWGEQSPQGAATKFAFLRPPQS